MSKGFWSYNYRLITTMQQHENLQLIVASSQVDQLWQHVVTHSNPVCSHQQTTVAKYPFHRSRGGRRTISGFMSDENRVFMVASPKTETETETRGFQDQDQDQDSEVPRPRPRPRLVKRVSRRLETKTQVSRTPNAFDRRTDGQTNSHRYDRVCISCSAVKTLLLRDFFTNVILQTTEHKT